MATVADVCDLEPGRLLPPLHLSERSDDTFLLMLQSVQMSPLTLDAESPEVGILKVFPP